VTADMKIRTSGLTRAFNIIAVFVIVIVSIACLFPFVLILSGSLTDNNSILKDGYHLIPKVFSLDGYATVFAFPDTVLRAYGVTIFTTIVGTTIGLLCITMAGYVLQRKDFKYRNGFSFFIYFTTMFSGGLVPWYILITKYLMLTDSMWVLIMPLLMNPFLIILMKSFMRSTIPDEIIESGKIDGANDFVIFYRIIIFIAMPGIATIGLFLAIGYWNDWFLSSLYINDPHKYQLQFYLYNFINNVTAMNQLSQSGVSITREVPAETVKMAMSIVVTGPAILIYPFVQRYFVKGLTIGAVKG
jgi:putative aldouronate transport system permease protein